MKNIQIRSKKILADTITPVSIYLKLRDTFANSFLLESSDFHAEENSFSYICCYPLASIKIENGFVEKKILENESIYPLKELKSEIFKFVKHFNIKEDNERFIKSALFGYFNYEANPTKNPSIKSETPIAQYTLFKFIIALDHFKNECHIIEAFFEKADDELFDKVEELIKQRDIPNYPFKTIGKLTSNKNDKEFNKMVNQGINKCKNDKLSQIILSRKFSQGFHGDDFEVYRHLRSLNPSAYLFYFDYGNFKLFGSSPEAQIVLKNGIAEINPIAGTFKRSGNDKADQILAKKLIKEQSLEHKQIVKSAKEDLKKCCKDVEIYSFKEIQFFSHVIHLVSKVKGKIKKNLSFLDVVFETFPSYTLTGIPKQKAIKTIKNIEKNPRGFYGGMIGFMDFCGNFNHAILIRTFISKNGILSFQAGARINQNTNVKSKKEDIFNKILALEEAIKRAKT